MVHFVDSNHKRAVHLGKMVWQNKILLFGVINEQARQFGNVICFDFRIKRVVDCPKIAVHLVYMLPYLFTKN